MAHRRGSRFPRTSASSRRPVTWEEGPFGSLTGITTSTQNVYPTAQTLLFDNLTVVRVRGEVTAYITVAGGAANEGFRCAFGMCVVSENAAGIGVTAVPGPLTDIAWDGWFVYELFDIVITSSALIPSAPEQEVRIKIDSKAMRKLHATDVIIACFETSEIGEGTTMATRLSSRMLLKTQ